MGDWLDGIGRCLSPISPFPGPGKGISLRCWTRWRRRGTSARLAALVLGIHVALQQVDLYFLIPHIVGRQVRLHPMVVIIGIIGGGNASRRAGHTAARAYNRLWRRAGPLRALLVVVDLPPWEDPDAHDEEEGGNGG